MNSTPKKTHKSTFRKVNDWLHLWLGLISGAIVFVVCITGCIWVFNEEITAFIHPERSIPYQSRPVLKPSEIRKIAEREHPGQMISYAYYLQDRTLYLEAGDHEKQHYGLHLNPYTGRIIDREVHHPDKPAFFEWILEGHRFLWLPWEIGRPIVNYGTLVFVVLLITGLIWWYPRKWTKSTADKSFKIKWGASFKRINIDLHNVLGFYAMLFLLAIALTGMVWGMEWYSKSMYWVTSGGDTLPDYREGVSDSLQAGKFYTYDEAMDKAWEKVLAKHTGATGFFYGYPDPKRQRSAIEVYVYPSKGKFYDNVSYAFDRHTLKSIPGDKVYGARFEGSGFGTRLRKMNYDIHVGSILGFPGKVLAFLSTLIGASLPVTGFIIWWNRKGFGGKKGRSKPKKGRKDLSTLAGRGKRVPVNTFQHNAQPVAARGYLQAGSQQNPGA